MRTWWLDWLGLKNKLKTSFISLYLYKTGFSATKSYLQTEECEKAILEDVGISDVSHPSEFENPQKLESCQRPDDFESLLTKKLIKFNY